MNVTRSGWIPNKFVLERGVPVKWIIDGQQLTGCNSGIQVPSLGLRFSVQPGLQTIEFTPNEAGTIGWSCFMNMMKGVFIVEDKVNLSDKESLSKILDSAPVGSSGGGCGCGG